MRRGERLYLSGQEMKIHKFSPIAIDRNKDVDEYSSSLHRENALVVGLFPYGELYPIQDLKSADFPAKQWPPSQLSRFNR
jgi:hypothetical protein